MALALNNQYNEAEDAGGDIEVNYIWISINNALGKLYKYQELLPQSPAYTTAIAMNPTLRWRWMKKKAPHLLERSLADVLRLWERDYNSKAVPPQPVVRAAGHASRHEASSFDDFLLADDSDSFNATASIYRCHDYVAHVLLHSPSALMLLFGGKAVV